MTELAEILKPGFPVNCMNVAQQASNPEITTVGEWADYMTAEIPPGGRKELNNLISLEFTSTPLESLFFFSPPAAVNTTLSLGLQISGLSSETLPTLGSHSTASTERTYTMTLKATFPTHLRLSPSRSRPPCTFHR